ncbi:ATP-dependent helicase [Streptobacillus moniliformis]|uniref:DNA 3'-5' helicase n=1 Tax=Streptobacillus moniliformis (strain ATCC 14647 / DSM 12112 / NCTC 10651 / 9901) TaxID=519441 RepID=D1AYQ4_STRM9|nr:UvrD-helicase domain-containing protein [Streptobacillus moniliformis]ACZ01430.1 UvrD/REP helicase [Streptobacillus moniliformis DSM 12112]AVL43562.1 AAA family ATPase [Streptobacillus moniliformis]SQA13410.1 ATP-dependent DNA helicase pcrA [Streptobacillus moniliformis]
MSILDNLNTEQRQAAKLVEGQTLILAGAGSGKTRTLTFKIAYMIKEKNINPRNILALTFTNKAAKEMKERVETLVGDNNEILISTFHSFAVRLLRTYSERIGYTNNFNIYDNNDQKSIIKKILKSQGLDKKYKESQIISKISRLKELGLNYTNLGQELDMNLPFNREFKEIFREYQEKLEKSNAMDFSDLLVNAKALLDDEYVLDKIQNRYIYILIDEYQDTNEIQYQIVKKIAKKYKNICVVGDEDQSIYAFRGANIRNILNFEKDYPNANTIKLEQNYRSTQTILDAANSVIRNNKSSKGKKLWSDNNKGEKIGIYTAINVEDEATFISDKINELKIRKDKKYKDFTILYRTNAQSRAIEESLIQNKIPYKIYGGLRFFDRKEIKDLISYLLLINNPKDDLSFERVINFPKRSIGPKTIEVLTHIATKNQTSLFDAILQVENEISSSAIKKLLSFRDLINKYIIAKEDMTTSEILKDLMDDIDYNSALDSYDNKENRIENIQELINSIATIEEETGFLSLPEYLENVALNSPSDNLVEEENFVKLMTIHASKGLEFNTVFLVGVEEGLFPNEDSNFMEDELEEERRIFYVAITRAEEELYITHSLERKTWGAMTNYFVKPSRFIGEIQKDLKMEIFNPNNREPKFNNDNEVVRFVNPNKKSIENFNPFKFINNSKMITPKVDTSFKIGEKVKHSEYGKGIIKEITPKSITVNFSIGSKKIALKFAETFLERIE